MVQTKVVQETRDHLEVCSLSVLCVFRPGVLTVSGQNTQLSVQVPPVPLEKILEAPPNNLHRSSGLL